MVQMPKFGFMDLVSGKFLSYYGIQILGSKAGNNSWSPFDAKSSRKPRKLNDRKEMN